MNATICWAKVPGLRQRAIPESENLLLFTPERPALHWLNLNAWLIFELCDGSNEEQLFAAYLDAIQGKTSPEEAKHHLEDGLRQLQAIGVIASQPSSQ